MDAIETSLLNDPDPYNPVNSQSTWPAASHSVVQIRGGGYSSSVHKFLLRGYFYYFEWVSLISFESHSYLTGVFAAQLRRHLSNINVISNRQLVIWYYSKRKRKQQNSGNRFKTSHFWYVIHPVRFDFSLPIWPGLQWIYLKDGWFITHMSSFSSFETWETGFHLEKKSCHKKYAPHDFIGFLS